MPLMLRRPLAVMLLPNLRAGRAVGVWLFVVLMLVVSAERRLAEAHLDLRGGGTGIESDEALDGDEIRVRLTALNDKIEPSIQRSAPVPALYGLVLMPAVPCSRALSCPGARAPPAVSSSSA
jgi:hypothetical protein